MSRLSKPRVLLIETGGTIAQRKGRDGIMRPDPEGIAKRIRGLARYAEVTFEKLPRLIDSTNMVTGERGHIARTIYTKAREFDGFVVVHGTDTMADTASALTFMLHGLGKPVILTGSQRSAFEYRTDGHNNIHAAVVSATQDYGEVAIVFGNYVLRGPRAIKYDEEGFNAFESPRTSPIGKIGITIEPNENRITREDGLDELRLFTSFDTGIGFCYPMSGVSANLFDLQVKSREVHGFVFVGFGAGNIPKDYYKGIERARDLNKPIVVVTQCSKGAADMGIYETGSIPLKLGVIPGGDMTMIAATQKLMYALGKAHAENVPLKDRIAYVRSIINTTYAREVAFRTV